MQTNPFTELYKTYSTKQLAEIVSRPNDYQKDAVIAAQSELNSRNISAAEIDIIKQEILNTPPLISKAEKLTTKATNYTAKKVTDFVFVKEKQGVESLLNRFTISLFILALLKIYTDWSLISFMLFDKEFNIRHRDLIHFFEFLALPIIFLLIWRRKRNGWFLLCFYAVYGIIMTTEILYLVSTWKPSKFANWDALFPKPSPAPHILWLIFWGGALYFICRKDVREIFNINTKTMLYSIIIPTLIVLFFMWVEL